MNDSAQRHDEAARRARHGLRQARKAAAITGDPVIAARRRRLTAQVIERAKQKARVEA